MAEYPLEIDVQAVRELRNQQESFLFLDCREPDEHAYARISGTVLIPMQQLPGRIQELAPYRDKRIVVHCHHGGRSMRVTQWLREQGFSQAQNLAGGIDAWSQQVDPQVPRY
ncbi:MAG: rhodanese-like domain-containing protein [Pirellulaceae bacterium]